MAIELTVMVSVWKLQALSDSCSLSLESVVLRKNSPRMPNNMCWDGWTSSSIMWVEIDIAMNTFKQVLTIEGRSNGLAGQFLSGTCTL